MKKIDKQSKRFNRIKNVIKFLGLSGGSLAFDAVVFPFIETTFRNHRIARTVATYGMYNLSMIVGIASYTASDVTVNTLTDAWNIAADKVNGDEPINGDRPIEENDIQDCDVREYDTRFDFVYTFFGDDADVRAHDIVIKLEALIDKNGFVSVNDLREIQHRDAIEDGDIMGWTKGDLFHSEIESLLDSNNHVGAKLTLPRPHDISEHYVVIKPVADEKEE